jgi:predicted Kef-type K+ transport protein
MNAMEAIWVGAAFGLGWLASRLGLPPLVGYLGAGFLLRALGHRGGDLLHAIADLGVLLLLFTVGLKLRFASLLRWEVLGAGGFICCSSPGSRPPRPWAWARHPGWCSSWASPWPSPAPCWR